MILAFQMPASYFDLHHETIDSATEKCLNFLETEENIPLDGIVEKLSKGHMLDSAMLQSVKTIATDVGLKVKNGSSASDTETLRNLITTCFTEGKPQYHSDMVEIVFTLCSGVKRIMKWWPRVTQICSTVILLLADREQQGHLLEIATGEGKSCVVAMLTTALALQGEYVDIVTSSTVLAGRDAEEWRQYYDIYGLSVGCNAGLINSEDRVACYKKNIVYGTVADFAADILRQEFEMDDVRGEHPKVRRFDNIMVDEVDQMTLDQGVKFTYLSHHMVGIRQLEPVLAIIWATVQQNIPLKTSDDELLFAGPKHFVFDAIVQALDPESCGISNYSQLIALAEQEGLVTSSFAANVQGSDMSCKQKGWKEFDVRKMLDYVKALDATLPVSIVPFMIDGDGLLAPALAEQTVAQNEELVFILVLENGMACPLFEMEEVALGTMAKVKGHIKFTKSSISYESQAKIKVPGFLERYVENRLPIFIKSAFTAMTLTENREYVVNDGQVFPVDFGSTGVVEKSKKWGDGLQQFIEMKHYCAISSLSLVTNFMSNLAFFKRFKNIFGVSGTLGTSAEFGFLQEHYHLKITKMPTHKEKKLYTKDMQIVESSKEAWFNTICNELKNVVLKKSWGYTGRAALVICEDIKTAAELHGRIKQQVTSSTHLYIQNDTAGREVLGQKFNPGDILVATNLAGRGTNVKVTDEVNHNGGLFVLLSFIPANKRVELQALGRTARKWAPGSGKIVAYKGNLALYFKNQPQGKIMTIRDKIEANRINHMRNQDIKEVALREKLFSQYCEFLEDIYERVQGDRKEEITLSSLHETWGIWLQMQSEKIEDLAEESLKSDLDKLVSEAKTHIYRNESPSQNIYHTTSFANELIRHGGDQQPAIDHFTKAISMDSEWASIAYYNRAKCILQQSEKNYMSRARSDLVTAEKRLRSDIESAMAVYQILVQNKTAEEVRFFSEQCERRQQIINAFRENIEEAYEKLQELIDNDDDAIVETTAVFNILPDAGEQEFLMLQELDEMGLEEVYQVKKKPVFSLSALFVTLLGFLQVVAGAFLVATGIAATFGIGLISEGISDIADGIQGMITGDFSLKDWAIQKAASIAISVVTCGLGKAIFAAKKLGLSGIKAALKSGFKSGIQGVKSAMKSGLKQGIKNTTFVMKGSFKETFKHVSETGWKQTVKKNLKKTAAYIGKEMAVQCAENLVSYGIDQAFYKIMAEIEEKIRKDTEQKFNNSLLNGKLRSNCDQILLNTIPEYFLKDNQLSPILKKDILDLMAMQSQASINMMVSSSEVANKLGEYSKKIISSLNKNAGGKKGIGQAIEITYDAALISRMVADSVRLSSGFEEALDELLSEYIRDMEIQAAPRTLPSIVFKAEIGRKVSKEYSSALASVLKHGVSATLIARAKQGVNMVVRNVVGDKILEIEKTKDQIMANAFAMNLMYYNPSNPGLELTKDEKFKFITMVRDPTYAGSLLEMRIASEKLGLDIRIYNEDKNGKRSINGSVLNTNAVDGTNTEITLVYRSDCKHTKSLFLEDESGNLHPVKANDVFQAITKGTEPDATDNDILIKSRRLRHDIISEVQNNTERWSMYVSQKISIYTSTLQRQILLDGNTSLSAEDPLICKMRLSYHRAHNYIKTNILNVISSTVVSEYQLGLVRMVQGYAASTANPQPRPAGYDTTSRAYPSQSAAELVRSRTDGSSAPHRLHTVISRDSMVPSLTSLSAHSTTSLYSQAETNAHVVDRLVADRITLNDLCGFLRLSFTSDFPDDIRRRYSYGYQDETEEGAHVPDNESEALIGEKNNKS